MCPLQDLSQPSSDVVTSHKVLIARFQQGRPNREVNPCMMHCSFRVPATEESVASTNFFKLCKARETSLTESSNVDIIMFHLVRYYRCVALRPVLIVKQRSNVPIFLFVDDVPVAL